MVQENWLVTVRLLKEYTIFFPTIQPMWFLTQSLDCLQDNILTMFHEDLKRNEQVHLDNKNITALNEK